MQALLKTPHYRIDDPNARLSVEFVSEACAMADAPKVTHRMTRPERATVFATREKAQECFALYLVGRPLDIVRVDA